MRIAGLVTSVGYAVELGRTLPWWMAGLDRLLVVTAPGDEPTIGVCRGVGAPHLATDAFGQDGSAFNKAAALDAGLATLGPRLIAGSAPPWWLLFFDADVLPPHGWRKAVEAARPEPGWLHGASRENARGVPVVDAPGLAGFFHLFRADDPAAADRPLFGSWASAAGYDTAFEARWPEAGRRRLPLFLRHLGEPVENWCGRGNTATLRRLFAERRRRGGWEHERLDAPR